MKTIHYGILAAGLTILAAGAMRNHARDLKRKNAVPKPKPEALQEWEGEGGALRGAPQMLVPATAGTATATESASRS
jgi:hypothetical protein